MTTSRRRRSFESEGDYEGSFAAITSGGLDLRRPREQLGCLRHQRFRDLPREMGLSAGIVREEIHDGEIRRSETDREPCDRRRFVLHQREAPLEESLHLSFFPGLGLEWHEQPNVHCHATRPFQRRMPRPRDARALPRDRCQEPSALSVGVHEERDLPHLHGVVRQRDEHGTVGAACGGEATDPEPVPGHRLGALFRYARTLEDADRFRRRWKTYSLHGSSAVGNPRANFETNKD